MRSIDPANRWNIAILVLVLSASVVGLVLSFAGGGDRLLPLTAGATAFLAWALSRELDPDHQIGAIVAAVVGAIWALLGLPTSVLPFVALLMACRLVVESTGRRPLTTDLIGLAILAGLVSYTPLGWVMGFGLGVAIYVDDRMADERHRWATAAAIGGAVAASLVVNLTGGLPETFSLPEPVVVALTGLLALLAVLRTPVDPVSFVDSRSKRFIRSDRLHATRAMCGLLLFAGTLIQVDSPERVIPMAVALVMALGSEEVERLRRARSGPR